MAVSGNAQQVEFWNAEPGQNWVKWQPDLDRICADVTDLLIGAADLKAGGRVLDIGCGAGATTFAFADIVAPRGNVLGVDISEPLLGRAEERRLELGAGNVAFELADAQDHPFDRGAFDVAVSRFGVMFFSDTVAAFRNIASALDRGGRFVFVAWAGPEHNPWFTEPQRAAVARLGPVEPSAPEAPGPMAFRDTDRVLSLLAKAGFSDSGREIVDVDLHHPGGLDAVMRLVGHVGPIARMMREKKGSPEDRDAIFATIASAFESYRTADGIRIPARVSVFQARAG